jgi:hypothetical protein
MAGKRRHSPATGESPISDTSEIHDNEQEQTIRLDANRWEGFRDSFGEREFGIDEHGRSIELLRLKSPFTPLETALKARVGRLASFDNAGVGRALGVDRDDRTGRLVLVSERVAGIRLSALLDRAFGRSLLPDLAAALFVLRRLLAIAHALHRGTGIANFALSAERVVVTPRAGVVLVESAIAGGIEAMVREGGVPADLRLPPWSGDATAVNSRPDVAHIATVGVSMILGRAFEPDERIDPLSPVLQEVEEVAAIRAGKDYAFALRQWLDRALTIDPELAFPSYLDARLVIEAAEPPSDCMRVRPALERFVQKLAPDSVGSAEAASIELERLRAIRVRQAASRIGRPSPSPAVAMAARQTESAPDREPSTTDDVFWRRAVAARFQAVRHQGAGPAVPANTADSDEGISPVEPAATVPVNDAPRLVVPPPTVSRSPVEAVEDPNVEQFVAEVDEQPPVGSPASTPVVEEPVNPEETRLAWVRAVTQQLEAARSAERAHAGVEVPPPPKVEVLPPPKIEVPPPVEVPPPPVEVAHVAPRAVVSEARREDPVEEVTADPPVVTEAPAVLAIPTSRLADEPTLAELHDLLTARDESDEDEEKTSGNKGSWLQAIKAHLRFTRRASPEEGAADQVEVAVEPRADEADTAEASEAGETRISAPQLTAKQPAGQELAAPKPETVAVLETKAPGAAVHEDDEDSDFDQESPLGGLRARDPDRQAWTAAVTSALAVPEPKAAPAPKAAPLPALEVVHPATSIDAPRPIPSTPVPRAAPALPLPDFEEEAPRRGVPRWAIWAGVAASVAGVGGYLYTSASGDSAAAEETSIERSMPAAPASGSLSIISDPPGATVILDGTERGVTPLKLAEIAPGSHRLQLTGQGGTVSRTVSIAAGEEARVDEAIFSGWIAVFAPFEVQIFADGKQIGTTADARIMLAAGPHDIQLVNTRLGYRQTHKLEVKPGEVSPLNVAAPEGVVKVVAPPDSDVFVDGERVGKGSRELRVPIGTREVLVRHLEGEQKMLVTVTLAQPAEVTVGEQP